MFIDSLLARFWTGAVIAALFAIGGYTLLRSFPSVGTILLVFAALLAFGVAWSKLGTARLPAPPGAVFSINGTDLHILAEGRTDGSYPVIWVAGGHGEGLVMNHLHQSIRNATRSILFDRPGSGWSNIGRLPLTTSGEVAQLKLLLEASGESGPFVLVGHSFGGLFSVNFAHHYPELVAGLVLLDPTPPWNVAFAGHLSFGSILRTARWRALTAQFGLGIFADPEIDDRDSDFYRALAEHEQVINAHSVEPKSVIAEASIFHSAMINPLDLVIGDGALGDIPLVLISANEGEQAHEQTRESLKQALNLTDQQVANLWAGQSESVPQQVRLSSRGQLVLAPEGASHMFPYEHPEFVLTEVRKLIGKASPVR